MDITPFACVLRSLRKERGLTQTQLAKAVGLSQRQISLLESGKEIPRADTVNRLRMYFELGEDRWHCLLEQEKERIAQGAPPDTIGRRVRVMRTYFKQSQSEFAKELGISQSAMSAIEKELSTPSYEVICALGRMGFHLNWILYGESDSLPPRAVLDHVAGSHELQKIDKMLETLPPSKLTAVRKAMELLLRS